MSSGAIIKREGKRGTSYLLKYDVGRDHITGKRKTKYKTVRGTRKAAQTELTRLLNSVNEGMHVDPSKMTVNEWLDHWLIERAPGLGMKTRERYAEVLRLHVRPVIGQAKLQALNAVSLQQVIAKAVEKGSSAGTVGYVVTLMKDALKSATRARMMPRNPCDDLDPKARPKKTKRPMRALDANGVVRLLTAFEGKRLYPLIRTAIGTGLRRGELFALRWRDLDLEARTVRVSRSIVQSRAAKTQEKDGTKTDSGVRTVQFTMALAQFLRGHWKQQAESMLKLGLRIDSDALLFPDSAATPAKLRNPDLDSCAFRRSASGYGFVGLRFHDLRHTYATLLLASGANIKAVSERLGHSDVKITLSVYSHVLESMNQDATDIAEKIGL